MTDAKNILVITYWSFDNALIQTYTLPYVKQMRSCIGGGKIFLFTLSQKPLNSPAVKAQIEELKAQNIFLIDFKYRNFGLFMVLKMIYILKYLFIFCYIKKIHTIHAWCTPGGAIAYIVSVFTGKRLVLDSFEPHAETMAEGGTWSKSSFAYKVLFKLEKLQLKHASEVICAAPGMIAHSQEVYKVKKPRYFVKPACVDLELFSHKASNGKIENDFELKSNVCVYAGKFGGIYLEREVFDFFKACYDHWNGDFTVLLLTSHSEEEILNYCALSGFPRKGVIKRFVGHHEVPYYMSLATFGFCPVKPLPSKRYCTPIKNGEYWAMGLPIVITRDISIDSDIISGRNIGYMLKEQNIEEYKKALLVLDLLRAEKDLPQRIREVALSERNFADAARIYQTIYA